MKVASFCLALLILGCRSESHPAARRLLLALPSVDLPPDAGSLVLAITHGTRFDGKWEINGLPEASDALSILYLRDDARWQALGAGDALFAETRQNCSAMPAENSIICDASFVHDFLQRNDMWGSDDDAPLRESVLTRWIIGHELGHLINGDAGVPYFERESSETSLRNLDSQRREYRADCYFFEHALHRYGEEDRLQVQRLALELINTAMLQRSGGHLPAGVGILFDYNMAGKYDFRTQADHPELLMRAVRFLQVSARVRHDRGLRAMIRPFLRSLVADPLWMDYARCGEARP